MQMRMRQAIEWLAAAVESTARNVLRRLVRGVLRQSRHHNLDSTQVVLVLFRRVWSGKIYRSNNVVRLRNNLLLDQTKTYTFCQV